MSVTSTELAKGKSALCVAVLPVLSVTFVPRMICPATVSNLVSAPRLYLASSLLIKLPAGPAFTERFSSPTNAVSAGTMIGNVSLYCPVLRLIVLLGTRLSGRASVSKSVRAVITMSINSSAVVVVPVSAT